ncbi:MAG TPA: YbfB/YjiJ family MFS transporter [Burkholderiaceae bacterium]
MHTAAPSPRLIALGLSLGAAVALGIARFSYALLLVPMRTDLGWTYFLSGAMNTANALGYLLGALATPALLRRMSPRTLLLAGSLLTALFLLVAGIVTASPALLVQRTLAGMSSAWIFIAGGILVSRLGSAHPSQAGLLLGLYYGGTGIGIVLSALIVPAVLAYAAQHALAHGWQWAWLALAALCVLAMAGMAAASRHVPAPPAAVGEQAPFRARQFAYGLAGYFAFGVGYIGYMTFIVVLLKERGMATGAINLFYAMLGAAVIVSSFLWARMLDRHKGGQAMAVLNGLLGVATILPVLTNALPAVLLSGLLFGAVFLSVVTSSTALVRHNLQPGAWAAGISAFTIVFALGQIAGPSIVGAIADGSGLAPGLTFSAVTLFLGSALALRQRALG